MDKEQLKVLDTIANGLYATRYVYKDLNEFDQAIWDHIHLYFDEVTTEKTLKEDLSVFPFSQEEINEYHEEILKQRKVNLSLPAFNYISDIIWKKGVAELGVKTLEDLFK